MPLSSCFGLAATVLVIASIAPGSDSFGGLDEIPEALLQSLRTAIAPRFALAFAGIRIDCELQPSRRADLDSAAVCALPGSFRRASERGRLTPPCGTSRAGH